MNPSSAETPQPATRRGAAPDASPHPAGDPDRAGRPALDPLPEGTPEVVFLLDVDNTLIDNDAIAADLRAHLADAFGAAHSAHYWAHFEAIRKELGYADYLGALQRYRADVEQRGGCAQRLLAISGFMVDYPFETRLYPRALEVVERLGRIGPTVILSDGDVVFQPRKIQRSGLWDAVGGRVMIFVHKEQMLDQVQRDHPAGRYVMVDDKERILDAMKAVLGPRLVTVFPRQGHYANDPQNFGRYAPADCSVERIGDLIELDVDALLRRPAGAPAGGGAAENAASP